MKITKIDYQKKKLFSLKLLKTRIYTEKKTMNSTRIKTVESHLKKALHIIYKFHTANKKILFIGTPLKENRKFKQLLTKTRHTFLPELTWIQGAISNSSSIVNHLFKRHKLNNVNKKKSNYLFNLNNSNYNLIVVLNESINYSALQESLNKRVPIVSLNYNDTLLDFNPGTYKILGNFNFEYKKTRNNYFYSILNSIFKKAEKTKKPVKKVNYLKKKRRYKHFNN